MINATLRECSWKLHLSLFLWPLKLQNEDLYVAAEAM